MSNEPLKQNEEPLVVVVLPYSQAYELLMRCYNHGDVDTPEFEAALLALADAVKDALSEQLDTEDQSKAA